VVCDECGEKLNWTRQLFGRRRCVDCERRDKQRFDLALAYDAAGNVATLTDKTSGERDAYSYDQLNRLTAMTVNGVGGSSGAQYGYDLLGNMTQKQEGASSLTETYWFGPAYKPHAVLGVSGSQTLVFAYDQDGNSAPPRRRCRRAARRAAAATTPSTRRTG
jgi:YD repeat-containing protein